MTTGCCRLHPVRHGACTRPSGVPGYEPDRDPVWQARLDLAEAVIHLSSAKDRHGHRNLSQPDVARWADRAADCRDIFRAALADQQLGTAAARQLGLRGKGEHLDDLPPDLRIRQFPTSEREVLVDGDVAEAVQDAYPPVKAPPLYRLFARIAAETHEHNPLLASIALQMAQQDYDQLSSGGPQGSAALGKERPCGPLEATRGGGR